MGCVIDVNNISKMYKLYEKPMDRLYDSLGIRKGKKPTEFFALNNIRFQVKKGETLGIIGTNGSGKSTLLKIITGVLNQTTGDVHVHGKISALLELGAGFNMEYTGIENIYLNGTMQGYTQDEITSKLDDIIEFADIGEFINQPVKAYSSGMFVRLAFAVAINIDPEILIVDEALSVGDVFFQAKCYKKFNEFKEKGKTVLLVTHDMGSIITYCDRAILLNNGVKLGEGEPKDMVDMYKKVLVDQLEAQHPKEDIATQHKHRMSKKLMRNPKTEEYGNKEMEILDFYVCDEKEDITNTILKGTYFKIGMSVRLHTIVQNPILAFTIKDSKGNEISGTNTMVEHIDVSDLKCNTVYEISFKQKMVLQGGQYLLSLGISGFKGDDFTVYHRLYDVVDIAVVSDKNTVGYFDMDSIVEFKELED